MCCCLFVVVVGDCVVRIVAIILNIINTSKYDNNNIVNKEIHFILYTIVFQITRIEMKTF